MIQAYAVTTLGWGGESSVTILTSMDRATGTGTELARIPVVGTETPGEALAAHGWRVIGGWDVAAYGATVAVESDLFAPGEVTR